MLSTFWPSPDDYIAIGADCDELGAQVEEYILYIKLKICFKQMFVLLQDGIFIIYYSFKHNLVFSINEFVITSFLFKLVVLSDPQ